MSHSCHHVELCLLLCLDDRTEEAETTNRFSAFKVSTGSAMFTTRADVLADRCQYIQQ